ncbi:TPA: aminoacyl-tRNA hydrolase [Candidatus Dependentiae bacterium]|nr:MAG: Peptidyl-tRNA hydrolase [candidate division TM6 bacterium GW2011_GWE2_31_21]KKP53711.1 MAG: Peptidyl-tRNA hydrolase [candidate division TM6 bacterium GW2011_GWF2_33_332]HBS48537.1 aminoacyl-tRNA hydrolase [Candidatus Dependentiae bacterium]HBZ73152.1 aminoacyl-tRNA hydrolase [Candidatus Dependentiae bacterium]
MLKNNEKINIKAIIGLGNPGSQYSKNRHNIGFRIIEKLAEELDASWKPAENLDFAEVRLNSQNNNEGFLYSPSKNVYLIKPQTFMNNSGKVLSFLQKRGINAQEILVIHDEIEKKLGKIGIKFDGSSKGHNGLKSIISSIGGDFWRFYFGVDRPTDKDEVPKYVLSNFSPIEEIEVTKLISNSTKMIKDFLLENI